MHSCDSPSIKLTLRPNVYVTYIKCSYVHRYLVKLTKCMEMINSRFRRIVLIT